MNDNKTEPDMPTERYFTVVYKLTDANTAKYLSNRDWVSYVYADSMAELASLKELSAEPAGAATEEIDQALSAYAQAFAARVNGWTRENGDDFPGARIALFKAIAAYAREISRSSSQPTPSPQAAQQAPAGAWIERWYGSGGKEGYEGWSIVSKEERSLVAYLGRGVEPDAVTEIVMAHNAAPAAPSTPASPTIEGESK